MHLHEARKVPLTPRAAELMDALSQRVVIADGAMGTMLQDQKPTLDDFLGHEGCNEILNVTRPDIVTSVHDAYFETGVDCVETNTFGANWSNLSDYGIDDRIEELARAGAALARESAEKFSARDGKTRWVLGSMGPGTKLPSLGHTTYAHLKDTFALQAKGLIEGGSDAFMVETSQDLLQTKAAINACRQAIVDTGIRLPIFVEVTVETTGTMLLGSEIGAALTALEPLGIDMIGLNCATGPAEMSEHLRQLSQHSQVPVMVMPNAGLPILSGDGAFYPLTPTELATAHEQFVKEFGLAMVGGCCGTTPAHLKAVVDRLAGTKVPNRKLEIEPGVSSLYQHVPLKQDNTYLAIGERTNANGSKAFRDAMLEERWDDCVEIAKKQVRDGAHLLDVCVDYVGRDGVRDITEIVSRFTTSSTLPLVIDSTEPEVMQAGLELIGGRPVINSVNFEDGYHEGSRFRRTMPLV
ncbi:MAG: methionine synthase, partial [Actinomycetota bacterium]